MSRNSLFSMSEIVHPLKLFDANQLESMKDDYF
jgi:hypothetical protein